MLSPKYHVATSNFAIFVDIWIQSIPSSEAERRSARVRGRSQGFSVSIDAVTRPMGIFVKPDPIWLGPDPSPTEEDFGA
ncbi:hypothetical protein Csa_002983 [Cucumis sativus]|uniref:Uncharacterized protein n=1 Tax=Cucumis sativus TaxID=3659 RepID=A0A0A0KHW8_CUCSA|nr:hypothetical protein Csa_002983 [Cucumis sativus]